MGGVPEKVQTCPVSQSPSLLQALLHAPEAHRKGEQSINPAVLQVPSPSQAAGVFSRVEPAHELDTQTVSAGQSAHSPESSQRPVVPQVAAVWDGHWGSGYPEGRTRQWPCDPASAHETQGPSQLSLQQMPLAQWPDTQSPSAVHLYPLYTLPQLRDEHWPPRAH